MFESQGVHATSTNPLHIHGPWFKDNTGRTVTLRGVNLSGASKMPVGCPSHQVEGFLDSDGTEISFVGRPFPLEDADEHLARLKHWGFNFLRFVVTWESIEHAGPGKYDYEFFDYLIKVFYKCKKYGFK
ncbi:MAG: glycoside hydrolase superfamily, partial [Podila humilis]